MIVGCFFDGDDDGATKLEQHDFYGEALSIIVLSCQRHVAFAVALLDMPWPVRWTADSGVDHRTLQDAHDILAAAWRQAANTVQPVLPLDGEQPSARRRMREWLDWLRQDVTRWRDESGLIALVMTILANQNTGSGYEAEDALSDRLRSRFSAVPWRRASANTPVLREHLPGQAPRRRRDEQGLSE